MANSYRNLLLLGAVAVVTTMAEPSLAQQSGAAPTPADNAAVETVTVSSTRIVRDGYQAPTPTTVIGEADIDAKAPANIADLVNELPALSGSATPASSGGGISSGMIGINALNLRNLGPNRTLVLLDGQRVGSSTLTGWVDINEFPEALIKRVDVVTGGASADYGSDAVAGVVNFVLDKDFTGLKGELSGGETTYGDGKNYKANLTWGVGFADGRGHVLLSIEDDHDDGITGYPRQWAYNANMVSTNPSYVAGNGQPQYQTGFTGFATATPGGIITTGPAKGVYFGPGGIPEQFNYGTVTGNYMIGGQSAYTYNYALQEGDMTPLMDRNNVFFRTSYDITDHFQIFGQASFGSTKSSQNGLAPATFSYFTVSPTNAFLPASVAAAAGTASFVEGNFLQDTGSVSEVTTRDATRAVFGASGDFDAAGSNWTWDGYGQTSINAIGIYARELNLANLAAGVNAVKNPTTGAIQCASVATNPTCVPYDLFGVGVNNSAAVNYVLGTASGHTKLTEDNMAVNLRGNPISDWAGQISIATGIEHRSEAVTGSNDPVSNNNGWRSGNQHASHGFYDVTEGYFETVVPLAKDLPFAKSLDFNGAVRETGYSISGLVTTWKVGLNYSPFDDISFRATHSIDIRAPNLSDLFAGGSSGTSTGLADSITHTVTGSVTTITEGTTNLTPEVANSNGAGIVVHPTFIPGFEASVDYYTVDIDNAIYSAGAQNLINQCAQGLAQACSTIVRNAAGVIVQVNSVPINIAQQVNRGLDVEASYRRPIALTPFLDGTFTARLLGTNYFENKSNNFITVPTNNVGTNDDNGEFGTGASLPHWKAQADLGWLQGPVAFGFTARAVSAGVYNTAYVQCTTGCPLSTAANPTINNNHLPGAIYFDSNISYELPYGVQVFLVVKDIFNTDPVSAPFGPNYSSDPAPASPSLYDILGRTFRAGVRFNM
jgi:iron complex outermembrane recepter protein